MNRRRPGGAGQSPGRARGGTRESGASYARIWTVVAQIPRGRVATYGQIARLAGLGRRARLVGYALRRAPSELALPWHRVINAQGRIAFPAEHNHYRRQQQRLRAERIEVRNGRVDLGRYRWRPEADGWPAEYIRGFDD